VAFAVLLVLVIVSLYRGWSGAPSVFAELPGDLWVAQEGTTDPFRASSLLPADRADELARVEGVAAVLPVYARRIGFEHEDVPLDVFFMAIGAPAAVPIPAAARERYFPEPGHVTIDAVTAADADVAVGDTLHVLGTPLVVERIRAGGNPIFQVAFLDAQDGAALLGHEGDVNFFLLSTRAGPPVATVSRAARAAVPGSQVSTSTEFADAMSELVDEGFLPVVGALVAIGLGIGGAVIALTTYTATIEKARDFGVLKAVGASNGFVYRIVVQQSLIVGVAGGILGVATAAIVATLVKRAVPEFVTDLRWADAAELFAAAVVVSIGAAYVPVRRINRIDPAMVFRA
jgi:putative ABC transport system permease protein